MAESGFCVLHMRGDMTTRFQMFGHATRPRTIYYVAFKQTELTTRVHLKGLFQLRKDSIEISQPCQRQETNIKPYVGDLNDK